MGQQQQCENQDKKEKGIQSVDNSNKTENMNQLMIKDSQENQNKPNLGNLSNQHNREEINVLQNKQEELIQLEIEKDPLVGEKIPLFQLMMEFENNNAFITKIMYLMQQLNKEFIRKTRKDGSCFYRCFIFRLCENLIENKQNFSEYKIFEKINISTKLLVDAGFEKIVFEDFQDIFKELMQEIQIKDLQLDELILKLQEKLYFNYLVTYLRFIISAFIRVNAPLFEIYFESEYEMIEFCKQEVEPITSDIDQIQIMALYQFFEIPLRIFYIDNSNNQSPTCFSLPDINNNSDQKIQSTDQDYKIQFLYRPGHYDIIYQINYQYSINYQSKGVDIFQESSKFKKSFYSIIFVFLLNMNY